MEQLKSLPLNQGQQLAAHGFFEFLFNKKKELILSGPGGVGKTYLMGYLIDQVMPQYLDTCQMMGIAPEYDEVEMTATTNKAAEVLAEATGRPTETIHSFLGLTIKDDYSTGRSILTKTDRWKVHTRKILFVDEAGMIDSHLHNMILEGTQDCKIVYVCDRYQLGPVMEDESSIFRESLPIFELDQPMRTNNPHLQAINFQLREQVKTGEFYPIQIVHGVIDHLTDDEMEVEISSTFRQQTHEARILAYTNARVIDYNEHIRGVRQLPNNFGMGEFLINNSAVRLSKMMMKVEEELEIIYQSSDTEMDSIGPDTELEIRRTTLKNRYGVTYHEVKVPVDRDHFARLLKYYSQKKQWSLYFRLKQQYPDLRQRDAATVHKSQGSSYDTVFIDLTNLSTCHQPKLAARLLYVAFSRARQRVVLYGNLAEKYGGLIQ